MLLSIGSEIVLTITSVEIDGGSVVIYVSDDAGATYLLSPQASPQRPGQPRPMPAPSEPPSEAAEPKLEAPTRPPQAPHEDDGAEDIAIWLAEHPEQMKRYMHNTLTKRRIIAKHLIDLVGDEIANSEAIIEFTAIDANPDSRWGDSSMASSMFMKGSMEEHIDRQTRQTASVPESMKDVKVKPGKGDALRVEDASQWITRSSG